MILYRTHERIGQLEAFVCGLLCLTYNGYAEMPCPPKSANHPSVDDTPWTIRDAHVWLYWSDMGEVIHPHSPEGMGSRGA